MNDVIERLKYTFIYEMVSPFLQRYEVYKWKRNGGIPPTPHLIKQQMVQKYAKRYKANIFVETGTYLGVMVSAVRKVFDKVYTIELDERLYRRAKKKYDKDRNIKVIFGDSSRVLPGLLSTIDEPTLFWLDAHYSGGVTGKGEVETPVLTELKQILKYGIKNQIILIDDANLFVGSKGYPTTNQLKNLLYAKGSKMSIRIENNIIVIK